MIEMLPSRIEKLCQFFDVSEAQLCKAANVNHKTFNAQLNRRREIPFRTLDRIARAWDIPLDYFSEHRPVFRFVADDIASPFEKLQVQAANDGLLQAETSLSRSLHRVSTSDVLDWMWSTGGVLENMDAIRESIDLFYPMTAEDNIPQPFRLGKQSLAKSYFKLDDEDHYVKRVQSFDPAILRSVKASHIEAKSMRYHISDVIIDVSVDGQEIREAYRRTILELRTKTGSRLTGVHAQILPSVKNAIPLSTDHALPEQ